MMRFTTLVATLVGNLVWVVATFLFAILAILVAWVPPRGSATFRVARLWSRVILAASGVRLRRRFAVELDPGAHFIYMANHQSMYDIPALLASLPGQTRFLAKRGLFRIPVFGWAIAAGGFIPVDRQNRSRARETFTAAVERLEAGASVLLFPEETRALDDRLLPFQRGGFLLALKSGLPIVPVGVRGTRRVRAKGSLSIRPGVVEVDYGRPIPTAGLSLRLKGELMAQVRREIGELAGLAPDGGGVALT